MEYEFTLHAKEMLQERDIKTDWVKEAVMSPDKILKDEDNKRHYFKKIKENENRVLHVVINALEETNKVITVYFDRNAGRDR